MPLAQRAKRSIISLAPFLAFMPLRYLRSRIDNVDTLRSRANDFDAVRSYVLGLGTDSKDYFGSDYAHEGGLFLQQNSYEITALVCLLRERGRIGNYLEIGSASGGTCRLLSELVGFETVTSLDDGRHSRAIEQAANFAHVKNFTQFLGDSHGPEAKSFMHTELPGPIDVAFVDGDHSARGVWADICLVKPYLARGAWLILHDTVPCLGVQKAWLKVACSRDFKPLAEFIGSPTPMGIAVAEYRV